MQNARNHVQDERRAERDDILEDALLAGAGAVLGVLVGMAFGAGAVIGLLWWVTR